MVSDVTFKLACLFAYVQLELFQFDIEEDHVSQEVSKPPGYLKLFFLR